MKANIISEYKLDRLAQAYKHYSQARSLLLYFHYKAEFESIYNEMQEVMTLTQKIEGV